jgi:hypothetical protein
MTGALSEIRGTSIARTASASVHVKGAARAVRGLFHGGQPEQKRTTLASRLDFQTRSVPPRHRLSAFSSI